MTIHRVTPLLALLSLAACAGGSPSDGGTGLRLGIPHIDLSGLGIGSKAVVLNGRLQKTALGEHPTLLWGDTSLGPDCTPVGETRLEVATPPAHGGVDIRDGELYAVYPQGHPRAYCSGRLVTGVLAFYTAQKGYVGADQVVLRGVTADKDTRLVTIDIAVRPRLTEDGRPRPVRTVIQQAPRSPTPAPLSIPKPTIRDPAAPAPTVVQSPYPGE